MPVQLIRAPGDYFHFQPEQSLRPLPADQALAGILWISANIYLHSMKKIYNKMNREEKLVIWFSRLLRWSLGIFFIATGILYADEGGWPAILFGTLMLITGFFKPKRCMGECRTGQRS